MRPFRDQLPPDRTETVQARSALVLAPHPDDEVLGCGGLLLDLVEAGAAVRVLFLTDGAGAGHQDGGGDDPVGYAAERRREAQAVARRLGLAGVDHLDVADGTLGEHLERAAAATRRALLSQRPDLLLVPSPLEVSRDHRAAFAALHRLLAPLRDGGTADPLAGVVADLEVLVYEVNRPAYPDLLVDVGHRVGELEELMQLYASQHRRRGYWRASLGLRRYRTLTLPGGDGAPTAAEGYRRLTVDDFTTRSPAQLVSALGGRPDLQVVEQGPRVSVVVRTKDRPGLLAEALDSLAAQTWRRAEVVLVNDGGTPPEVSADYPLPLVRVDLPENRGRAAAAQAGVEAAGGDAVAFLDDDDLAAPEHLETLAGLLAAADVSVVYTDAAVGVYELDAGGAESDGGGWRCVERRLPYSRDFDPDLLLLDNYIPFNTLLIERRLFAEVGEFDTALPFFEDWDFLLRLAAVTPFHHLARVTCEYRHFRGGAHHVLGESPRRRADFLEMKERVLAKHGDRLGPALLARAVDTLRSELVDAAEAAASHRREAAAARREIHGLVLQTARLEDRWQRLNGEVEALRGERETERRELQRLYDEERRLREALAERDDHLGRTYGEIERLNARIEEMEATRAWRLHRRMEKLRGRG